MQYCVYLSRKLKMTVKQLFESLGEDEIELQMSYDKFMNEDFQKKLNDEEQQKQFDALSKEEQKAYIDRVFNRAIGGNK